MEVQRETLIQNHGYFARFTDIDSSLQTVRQSVDKHVATRYISTSSAITARYTHTATDITVSDDDAVEATDGIPKNTDSFTFAATGQ
jgi:hypothetical protein